MNTLVQQGKRRGLSAGLETEDAVQLGRPAQLAIVTPAADMGHALGLAEHGLAFAQVTQEKQAAQGTGDTPADLGKACLLRGREHMGMTAMMHAQQPRAAALRPQDHHHLRPDMVCAANLGRHGVAAAIVKAQRTVRSQGRTQQRLRRRGHGDLASLDERARPSRTRTLHRNLPVRRLRIAGVKQPGAVAVKDVQHGIEHVTQRGVEVAPAHEDAVDAIQMLQMLRLRG